MEQPPAGLAIHGLLRPALIEEHSEIQKHISSNLSHDGDKDQETVGSKLEDHNTINGHMQESGLSENSSIWEKDSKKDDFPRNRTSFYKLEMIKIQLFSALGNQVSKTDFELNWPPSDFNSSLSISIFIVT